MENIQKIPKNIYELADEIEEQNKDIKDIVKNSLAKIEVAITGLEHHVVNNQNLIIKSFLFIFNNPFLIY